VVIRESDAINLDDICWLQVYVPRVILIINNCSVGKIEISEYAILIISFFSDDQRSNKNILSCSSFVGLNFM
jgi:hypothetical protein